MLATATVASRAKPGINGETQTQARDQFVTKTVVDIRPGDRRSDHRRSLKPGPSRARSKMSLVDVRVTQAAAAADGILRIDLLGARVDHHVISAQLSVRRSASQLPVLDREVNGHSLRMFC